MQSGIKDSGSCNNDAVICLKLIRRSPDGRSNIRDVKLFKNIKGIFWPIANLVIIIVLTALARPDAPYYYIQVVLRTRRREAR